MKNRANGLALVSLLALAGSARAEGLAHLNVSAFGPTQVLATLGAIVVAVALVRELMPSKRNKSNRTAQ